MRGDRDRVTKHALDAHPLEHTWEALRLWRGDAGLDALAALDAVLRDAGDPATQPAGAAAPADEWDASIRDALLAHERRFWLRFNGLEPDSAAETPAAAAMVRAMDRAMAGVTLLGGVADARRLRALLSPDEVAGDWSREALEADLPMRGGPALKAVLALGAETSDARLGARLAQLYERDGSPEVARGVLAALPAPDRTVSLREPGAWAAGCLYGAAAGDASEAWARAAVERAVWAASLGRREDALAAAEEAVEIYRGLAAVRADAFEPDLATSLSVRGRIRAALGDATGAQADARASVELLWPFFERAPATHADLMTAMLRKCRARFPEDPPPEWLVGHLEQSARLGLKLDAS